MLKVRGLVKHIRVELKFMWETLAWAQEFQGQLRLLIMMTKILKQ